VLAVVAVGGIALAAHGWSARHAVLTPGSLAAGSSATSPASTAGAGSAPHHAATPRSASPTRSGAHRTSGGSAGPLLRSQSYASYAFLVWPEIQSSSARAAMTGLTISVHRSGGGISVKAGVTGQQAPSAAFYPSGAKVYIVEASLGDDANNTDYSLGDDGLVVTDSGGRIVR
jgi:hypothetical protein